MISEQVPNNEVVIVKQISVSYYVNTADNNSLALSVDTYHHSQSYVKVEKNVIVQHHCVNDI